MTDDFTDIDIRHMELAISLAEKAAGCNRENPLVGAVVAHGERVYGCGYHLYETIEHAEPKAIREAAENAKGATLYVNLEPCVHHGRTPPCTDAIIQSGIKKVFFSVNDTDNRVNGKGEQILKEAGIEVHVGLLAEKAKELNRCYLKTKSTGMPWITVKVAMSLDGKIGLRGVKGEYLSSRESLKVAHLLRACCDGIMVGANTVRVDNPNLTCRLDSFDDVDIDLSNELVYPVPVCKANPVRIVISSNPDFKMSSHIFQTDVARTIIVTGYDANQKQLERIGKAGVDIIQIKTGTSSRLDMHEAFAKLLNEGVSKIMVEGGGVLISSLVNLNLVDEFYIAIAPLLLGGSNSPTWLNESVTDSIKNAPVLDDFKVYTIGNDVIIRARKPVRK